MRYGHFDDSAKEYVIERPDTPKTWSNYLGDTTYGSVITNNAGGFSFFRSAAIGRFMRFRTNGIPADQPGRFFYLRDRDGDDVWSASWQPVGKPLDQYRTTTRFGTGYAIIRSEYAGIASEATYFVPLGQHFEYWRLRLSNTGSAPRRLAAIAYCEFANEWSMGQDMVNLQYTQYIVRCVLTDGMIDRSSNGSLPEDPSDFTNNDQSRWNWMALCGTPVRSWDGDREAFIGPYRGYHNPLAAERGACSNSPAYGDNCCGALHGDIDLAPGETRELLVLVGVGKAGRDGAKVRAEYGNAPRCQAEFDKVVAYWHGRLGNLSAATPDREFDSMVNVWNAYNCLITFAWSRAASLVYNGERDGLGYRDSVQDLMGTMGLITDEAKPRLELMLTGVESRGSAMAVVRPFRHRPGHEPLSAKDHLRSDDCLWLFDAVTAYIKETGDLAFLDKRLPYSDQGEATVLGHLRRAMEFSQQHSGVHGLPCGLAADWNDCLKMGYKGESVMVALQLRHAYAVYIELAGRLGRAGEADWARGHLAKLDADIQRHCWDGAWFRRCFCEDGSIIGSAANAEGQIFLNTQTWAVLSGAATPEQARTAMDSVERRLATEHGLMLCDPAFATVPCNEIRAVLFNPGLKENGGIFSHTQGWAVMAETMLGNGDRAYRYLRAFLPAAYNDRAEIREIEPYVHCQSTHSRPSPKAGASRLPWLSGTASWSYYAMTHHILGVRPDWDGLRLDPCLPSAWREITVRRRFRGRDFEITMVNGAKGKGVAQLTLNGEAVAGDVVPIAHCRERNLVRVTLR